MSPVERLKQGANTLGVELCDAQIKLLMDYLALIQKWNKVHNLTAITEPNEMVSKHLLDSLALAPLVAHEKTLCDVGTGAGLPGVVLAILNPEQQWILLDSSQKRVNFLSVVKATCELRNIEPVFSRVEDYQPTRSIDAVVSRAFSALDKFITLTEHLMDEHGHWYAMKGEASADEMESLDSARYQYERHTLQVPGLLAHNRHCVTVSKRSQ